MSVTRTTRIWEIPATGEVRRQASCWDVGERLRDVDDGYLGHRAVADLQDGHRRYHVTFASKCRNAGDASISVRYLVIYYVVSSLTD